MTDEAPVTRRTFDWRETAAVVADAWSRFDLRIDDTRQTLLDDAAGVVLRPPAVLPIPAHADSARDYLETLPERIGLLLIVLVQAGSTALGVWRDDELLRHKVIKKYVVRGRGRAQPTHLRTKGKSRYGSRLRLQGARSQLSETAERIIEWREELGEPNLAFISCPVRTWAELRSIEPPPFPRAAPTRVGFHVHIPNFEELLAVRRRLCRGSLTVTTPA